MKINQVPHFNLYQLTVLFSVLFTLVGFSYNVWRMEVTETNSNIRTACFEMLLELSSLEQLVYAAHYDNNIEEGNPRKGWVKVNLVNDLSALTTPAVEQQALNLKSTWSDNWQTMPNEQQSAQQIINAVDEVRTEIKRSLHALD